MVDYNKYLTDEQKANILNQRLQQFAAEAYQHEINKKFAEENNNQESASKSQEAIDTINNAMTLHETELGSLNLPVAESSDQVTNEVINEVTNEQGE